jgi:acyl carrier protein
VTDVASRIIRFIEDEILFRRAGVKLTRRTPLDSGMMDSLGMASLVTFLEEEFDLSVDVRDIVPGNFRTVGDIERLVRSKLATGAR